MQGVVLLRYTVDTVPLQVRTFGHLQMLQVRRAHTFHKWHRIVMTEWFGVGLDHEMACGRDGLRRVGYATHGTNGMEQRSR
jgi:hypothetical protein